MAFLPSSLFRDIFIVDAASSSETWIHFGYTPTSRFSPYVFIVIIVRILRQMHADKLSTCPRAVDGIIR